MNMHSLLVLAATALMAASFSNVAASDANPGTASRPVVNLPTVTVRPAPEDLAFYRSSKVVELATVTVRPAPQDRAYYLAHGAVGKEVRSHDARAETEQVDIADATSEASTQQVASR